MQNFTTNWLKIYLFYGAIFFSFGMLGWVGRDDVLERFQDRFNRFSLTVREFSDLPVPSGPEVPVFKLAASDALLFYSTADGQEVIEPIYRFLKDYCKKIELKPVHPSQSLMHQMIEDVSGTMQFGLEIDKRTPDERNEVSLYMDLPSTDEERLLNRLRKMRLDHLEVQHFNGLGRPIYCIRWRTGTSEMFAEISQLLLERLRKQGVRGI